MRVRDSVLFASSVVQAEYQALLDSYVSWAVQTSAVCEMKFKDRCRLDAGRKRALPFKTLVQCFIMSRDLRSRRALKQVLSKAIKLALDPALAYSVLQNEDWEMVPSASTLSRANLQVDIAYMLVLRKEFQAEKARGVRRYRFLKVDSSPQGGKDWLLSEVVALSSEDMKKLTTAFNALAEFEQDTPEHMDASQAGNPFV